MKFRGTSLLVVLSVLAMSGCAQLQAYLSRPEMTVLDAAREAFIQGQYRISLEKALLVVNARPRLPEYDQALYLAALNCLYVYPDDGFYTRSLELFNRLVVQCPGSLLLPESSQWIAVLNELAQYKHQLFGASMSLRKDRQQLEELRLQLKRTEAQLSGKQKRIDRLKKEVIVLKQKIDMLEKVDMQLYERKKDFEDVTDQQQFPGTDTDPGR